MSMEGNKGGEKKFIQFLHISLCVLSSTSTIKGGKEFLMGEELLLWQKLFFVAYNFQTIRMKELKMLITQH